MAKTKTVKGLRVTTKVDGFRRGGRAWHGTTELTEAQCKEMFTEEQGKALLAEPMLSVTEVDIEVDEEPAKETK